MCGHEEDGAGVPAPMSDRERHDIVVRSIEETRDELDELIGLKKDELTVLKALVHFEVENLYQSYREGFVPEEVKELGYMSTKRYERALNSLKGRLRVDDD